MFTGLLVLAAIVALVGLHQYLPTGAGRRTNLAFLLWIVAVIIVGLAFLTR